MTKDEEILLRIYEIPVEALWKAVKQALNTLQRATLKGIDEEHRRATFTTAMSWTSWGEDMIATVESGPTGSLLKVTGHAHTAMLTSRWGEEVHQKQFFDGLAHAIEKAIG
jgi:hypothetical protein